MKENIKEVFKRFSIIILLGIISIEIGFMLSILFTGGCSC